MLVLEVLVPILAFVSAPIWMSFPCRNLVLAIGFLVPTFDVLLRLIHRMDYSLNTYVPVFVWIGLACVRMFALVRSFCLVVEVQMV